MSFYTYGVILIDKTGKKSRLSDPSGGYYGDFMTETEAKDASEREIKLGKAIAHFIIPQINQ